MSVSMLGTSSRREDDIAHGKVFEFNVCQVHQDKTVQYNEWEWSSSTCRPLWVTNVDQKVLKVKGRINDVMVFKEV